MARSCRKQSGVESYYQVSSIEQSLSNLPIAERKRERASGGRMGGRSKNGLIHHHRKK